MGSLARITGVACVVGLLGGCGVPGGPPLVSAQFPPAAGAGRAEPQSLGSLPAGAANYSPAPGAVHPQYLAYTFRAL